MPAATSTLLDALDREIASKEKDLAEAKQAAARIADLTNDVVSLKRARAILSGDESQSMQDLIAEANRPVAQSEHRNGSGAQIEDRNPLPLSIGCAVVKTLQTSGKPMTPTELLPLVKEASGKPNLTYHTLSAVLSVYKRKRKIESKGQGRYTIPQE